MSYHNMYGYVWLCICMCLVFAVLIFSPLSPLESTSSLSRDYLLEGGPVGGGCAMSAFFRVLEG